MQKRIFAAALLLVILSSCGKMKAPEFRGIDNVQMKEINLGSNTVNLYLRYFNPNSFNGKLKWAEGEAWIDSNYLGSFVVDSSFSVPARQEFIVPVKLKISMKNMLTVAAPLLSEKRTEVWLRVEGKAKAGRGGIYKTLPLKYAGKQSIQAPLPDQQ